LRSFSAGSSRWAPVATMLANMSLACTPWSTAAAPANYARS
jgi:hypothetical protein